MKWGIVSPNSQHFKKKMQFAFKGKNCVFASRTPGTIELECFGSVQSVVLDEMLASDVDAVYICTPTCRHAYLVKKCLDAGKHVLVEKTPSDGYANFLYLRRYAEERFRKLDIVFQPRYKPWFYSATRASSGEATVHFPLNGIHENPIWDVAFYPIMTMGYLGVGSIHDCSFSKTSDHYRAVVLFETSSWILGWSINSPRFQQIVCRGHEFSDCFTSGASDSTYELVVDTFEETGLHGIQRPIDVLQQVFPIFTQWRRAYEYGTD